MISQIRKTILFLLMFVILPLGAVPGPAAKKADNVIAYEEVLSELIYSMFLFVRWPDDTFKDAYSPIRIVFLGNRELADIAHKKIGSRKVGNRHIVVEKVQYVEDIVSCHAIFISHEKAGELDHLLNIFSGRAVLTMGDSEGFSVKGVIFNFFTDKERVRFKSNVAAARRAGISISSELLKLSVIEGGVAHVD